MPRNKHACIDNTSNDAKYKITPRTKNKLPNKI